MKLSKMLICIFLLASTNVGAAVVTWTFENVELFGGGFPSTVFANGSFDYDATTNTYSNINITSAGTYNIFTNGDASYLDANGIYLGGGAIFNINYDAPLTDAGGTIGASFEETLLYTLPSLPLQLTGSGFVTGTPAVPVPPAVWLFGSGLIGLIGVARRKVRV